MKGESQLSGTPRRPRSRYWLGDMFHNLQQLCAWNLRRSVSFTPPLTVFLFQRPLEKMPGGGGVLAFERKNVNKEIPETAKIVHCTMYFLVLS